MPRNSASVSQVVTPGVSTSSGPFRAGRELDCTRHAARDLGVGCVVAALAANEHVLAGARRSQVVDRQLAAHDPALRLHRDRLHPAAVEDPVVRLAVLLEAGFRALLVAVERVGVLHDELADPQEAAPGPRLVAVLDLEVVPELRQLLVRADLARVERERLLVRQREDVVTAAPVGDVEDLRDLVATGRLPQLDRGQHGCEELLAADRVHFLADDLLDLAVDLPAEGQVAPQARAHLADEAASDEQLVAHRLGVGRIVAQRRKEEL